MKMSLVFVLCFDSEKYEDCKNRTFDGVVQDVAESLMCIMGDG